MPGVLRQVQVAVQQSAKTSAAHVQMDGDDAVVLLAAGSAVLVLHARCLVALFGHAGLVDAADHAHFVRRLLARGRQVLAGDAALQIVPHSGFIPAGVGQELLKGANRTAGLQGDGLDALAGKVREQSAGVGLKVFQRGLGQETGPKIAQVIRECRTQRRNLLGIDGDLRVRRRSLPRPRRDVERG